MHSFYYYCLFLVMRKKGLAVQGVPRDGNLFFFHVTREPWHNLRAELVEHLQIELPTHTHGSSQSVFHPQLWWVMIPSMLILKHQPNRTSLLMILTCDSNRDGYKRLCWEHHIDVQIIFITALIRGASVVARPSSRTPSQLNFMPSRTHKVN